MKIVISDRMEEGVVKEIRKLGDVQYLPSDLKGALSDADALIVRSATKVTPELLASAPKLKVVARGGVGIDNIDCDECKKRGIKVINTPGAPSNAVAELAIALMFSVLRKIPMADAGMKNGKWLKKELTGGELSGRTLGIFGLGRIGIMLAKKAQALGMKVLYYDPHAPESSDLGERTGKDGLLENSDVISLHIPLMPETKGFIGPDALSKMKENAIIINTARGGLIDEDALYSALKDGKIAGAGLDVYPEEPYSGKLCELENAVLTPHIAGSTSEAQMRIGLELVGKLALELKKG